jgi:hypothetical protein
MLQRLSVRVARLEACVDQGPRSIVVWLGPDGQPETPLEGVDRETPLIFLPRKSPSPEQWVRDCALRRQQWPEEDPPYAPSLGRPPATP